MNRNMSEGNPLKLILTFFVPILMGNLFQQFYNIVDSIIVGRYVGVGALAAVGSTGSLYFLVIGFVTGMCSGFAIPVAFHFGAKDYDSVRRCLVNILLLCIGIGAVLTTIVMTTAKPVLQLMNTPGDIFDDAYAYIIIIYAGIGVTMFYNILSNVSRAVGDSRTPLYFLVLASILNVGLDLLFIIKFNMRTAGAGYATVIAQAVSGILCFVYMAQKFPELHFKRKDIKPHGVTIRHLIHMGFPMALQFSITAIGSIILQSTINTLGSVVVASVTAASKSQLILTQPLEALGATTATYSSQNLGAGRLDRVRQGVRITTAVCFGFSLLSFGISNIFGVEISRLFISGNNPEIFAYVSQFHFYNSIFYWALGTLLILRNALQGLGYAVPAMSAGIFELVARAIVGILFVRSFGFIGICFANPAAWIAANIILVPVYFYAIKQLTRKMKFNNPAITT